MARLPIMLPLFHLVYACINFHVALSSNCGAHFPHAHASPGALLDRSEGDQSRNSTSHRFVVRQTGVGFCHMEQMSCFGEDHGTLGALMRTLIDRKDNAPAGSYTKVSTLVKPSRTSSLSLLPSPPHHPLSPAFTLTPPASRERRTRYKHHCEAPAADEDTGHVSAVRRGCLMTAHCSRASCWRSARSSWPPTTTRRLLLRRQTSFISHLPLAQGTESTWQRFSVLSLASTFGCAGGQSHHPQLGLGTPNASAYHVRTIFPHALCRDCADT
jgi:hypothetical protein